MTRVLKNRWFERFARKERISDTVLKEAVERAEKGLIDADLGGGVVKQRIAREGGGKSGGYRTLIVYGRVIEPYLLLGLARARSPTSRKLTLRFYGTLRLKLFV